MTVHKSKDELLKTGLLMLLNIKDSDIRIATLKRGDRAVDRGIHIGGAFSATVPMVSLFYGGFMNLDVEDPTRIGQDMFVLSKGHAVAAMASVYADLGYFDPSLLVNSRSVESILNGHPGPLLPGVQVATGPLGQGIAVAQGFAMAGKRAPEYNVFCITGDGELQEGVVWEAIMHAPQKRLDNLCMIVDKNEGQLDNHAQLIFSMDNLPSQIESFGWRVLSIDGTSYSAVVDALGSFVVAGTGAPDCSAGSKAERISGVSEEPHCFGKRGNRLGSFGKGNVDESFHRERSQRDRADHPETPVRACSGEEEIRRL